MFNYTILTETERIDDIHTYFNVKFYDDLEEYIKEYRVMNDAKEMEIENLKLTQFISEINILNILREQYDSIYSDEENNILNLIKTNEEE